MPTKADLENFERELEIARDLNSNRKKLVKLAAPTYGEDPVVGKTVLVIGDAHAEPNQSLRRFRWLGRMVRDIKPDLVVGIGDWWSLDSLGSFDKPGSVQFEGRRFWEDVDAGVAALQVYKESLGKFSCRHVMTLGNHEHRILRVAESDSRFSDLFSYEVLKLSHYGWEALDYLVPLEYEGIAFVHCFTQPSTSKTLERGVNLCRNVIQKHHTSGVFGHTHLYGYYEDLTLAGLRMCVLNVGCYFTHHMSYAGPDNARWRRGIAVLRNVKNGAFDPEWWSMERIISKYGP